MYFISYLLVKGRKILERGGYQSRCMLRFDPWIIPSRRPKEVESLDRYLAEPLSPLNMAERTYYNFQHLYATCIDTLLQDHPLLLPRIVIDRNIDVISA